jgi:nucleotide-binding universal stress UspA family protein
MSTPIILVPLDGTTPALSALPVARGLAEVHGGIIHVLHVSRRALPPEKVLEAVRLTPEELHGSVLDERMGEPAEAILQVSREMHEPIIVMCTHTGLPSADGPLGMIAEQGLLHSHCPIVLVDPRRGFKPWHLGGILVPHDGTPTTTAAIVPAAELARTCGANLTVLHVAAPGMVASAEPGSITTPRYMDQPQHEWPAWASEFLYRLSSLWPLESLQLKLALSRGETATAVVRHALDTHADLILLAWHGDIGPQHASIVRSVILDAPCPTMILRA